MIPRSVFMISDGTGITVELLTNSLLTQFEQVNFEKKIHPYIDSIPKAHAVAADITASYTATKIKPLVFMTLLHPDINHIIQATPACVFDVFNTFIIPLEQALQTKSSDTVGRAHSVSNNKTYEQRIAAINYTLTYDDGAKTQGYDKADIILIGVSRCGKTPSCLYMALQFGILAANYPFTDDDLLNLTLPDVLKPYKAKLFGLTIDADRLQHIRTERRPNSQYASAEQCRREINEVEAMYKREHIPYLNSTRYSIEEITTRIMATAQIERRI